MSGHNKWSKVKNKKAATDAKKSKIFSKYARLITVESKKARGDKNAPNLRAAIEKAKHDSMPADNIDRAIAKGIGGDAGSLEEVTYETYGPGGVALIITVLTDNKNRTGPELKHLLSKLGYTLAAPGSALWSFTHEDGSYHPTTTIPLSQVDRESLETLIDALEEYDDVQEVFTNAA
jgi:YebC/PmpR family DNA-binding regulatory protein